MLCSYDTHTHEGRPHVIITHRRTVQRRRSCRVAQSLRARSRRGARPCKLVRHCNIDIYIYCAARRAFHFRRARARRGNFCNTVIMYYYYYIVRYVPVRVRAKARGDGRPRGTGLRRLNFTGRVNAVSRLRYRALNRISFYPRPHRARSDGDAYTTRNTYTRLLCIKLNEVRDFAFCSCVQM